MKKKRKEWFPTNGHRERPKDLWEQMIKGKDSDRIGIDESNLFNTYSTKTKGVNRDGRTRER